MDVVLEWVKSIVFYLILLTVVMNLLPAKKYEKYVKLFTGMLLVLIVIKPITGLFSWDESFEKNFLERLGEEAFVPEDADLVDFEEVEQRQVEEGYKQRLEAFAAGQAEILGMHLECFSAGFEQQEGVWLPSSIEVNVSPGSSQKENGIKESGDKESIHIAEIRVADIVKEKLSPENNSKTEELKKILMEYYGLDESQVQVQMENSREQGDGENG